ncbi:MAG: kelch repeat-containing protein, partial [Elusimicrobiales bacterium]|nr:kelch repeat-containing protein [Elusimicrobiales bacterium]
MNPRAALYAALLLLLNRGPLAAGGVLDLAAANFAAGTGSDIEIKDGQLTLVKKWYFGGQGPGAMAARSQFGFAYDEARSTALAFGGQDTAGNPLGDTWLWGAGGWTLKTPAGAPSPRYGHVLVWAGSRFLLFGGGSSTETWTYDVAGDTWTFVPAQNAPPARNLPAMAYDPDRNAAVLFGGGDDDGTWVYDASAGTWTVFALSPAPPPRLGASMAYDRASKKIILFGGRTPGSTPLDDTWAFDAAASSWTEKAPSSKPSARWKSAMTYDPVNGRVILYGGFTNTYAGDIWFYNYQEDKWSQHY